MFAFTSGIKKCIFRWYLSCPSVVRLWAYFIIYLRNAFLAFKITQYYLTCSRNFFIASSADKIIQELNTVYNIYTSRGLNISILHGGSKFDNIYLREHIRIVSLNIFTLGCHIPTIKQSIQTTKKQACCNTHFGPYKSYTMLMIRSLLACIIHSRNYFSQKGSIIKWIGEYIILLGQPDPYFNINITIFGYYAMVYPVIKKKLVMEVFLA